MIIDDLDIKGMAILPSKADTPLIVDADAVLSSPVTAQFFETIAGWSQQII